MIRSAATTTTTRVLTRTRAISRTTATTTMNNVPFRALSSTSTATDNNKLNYSVVPKEDFGQYKEYSVIFTNRALNLMSDPFQKVMRDLNNLLCTTYNAHKVAIIPG
jgi:hypothetical protein